MAKTSTKTVVGRRTSLLCAAFIASTSGLAAAGDPPVALHRDWTVPGDQGVVNDWHFGEVKGSDGCGKAHSLRALYEAGLNPDGTPNQRRNPEGKFALPGMGTETGTGGIGTREASGATDVLNNNLDIEIFPSTNTITGTNTITVKSLANGLTTFTIRLRSNYSITQLKVDGTNTTSSAVGTYGRQINLPRAYNAGEIFTVLIGYTGVAASRGFGSIEFTTINGQPGTFTLSEPYFAATWWPTKDGDFGAPGDNSDKFTMQLALTAPSTYVTASNGLLQGVDTLSGNRKKYRWATNYQTAPYLVSFGSTAYNTWTKTYTYPGGSMPVQFFLTPSSDTAGNRAAWEKCLTMLETYRGIYGLYPFINEKYGMYEFTFGGGMEHQTMTGMGTTAESVVAHELGHQWWGDNVTCKTWNNIALNEGFATYTEALWEERKPGSSGLTALKAAMNARRPSSVNGSVYVYDADLGDINRIFNSDFSYDKGGWTQHMLRHVMGDTDFFNGLLAYRAAFENSGATFDDYFNIMSSVDGTDLSWFRDQWIYGVGAPQYQYAFQSVTINGQPYLRLYLKQVQSASYGMYRMPIDVKVNWSGGSGTYVVQNDALTEWFVIPVGGTATSILIDPDDWILNTGEASTAWVNGPAKIVQAVPAPGATIDTPASPSTLTITFSENVNTAATNFTVTSVQNGTVPFTYSYNSANFTATLNFGSQLPGGDYTVTVSDLITTTAAGIKLDGEIANAESSASLPSGNGQAAGSASFNFHVKCPADFDGSGFVDFDDFIAFVAAFEAGSDNADFDGSGFVDFDDFNSFVQQFELGC